MKRVHLYSSLTVEILLVNSHRPIWRAHIPSIIYCVLVLPEVHMPIKALHGNGSPDFILHARTRLGP